MPPSEPLRVFTCYARKDGALSPSGCNPILQRKASTPSSTQPISGDAVA